MTTQNEVAVNGGGKQYGTKLTVLGEAAIAGNVLEVPDSKAAVGGGDYALDIHHFGVQRIQRIGGNLPPPDLAHQRAL